MFWSVVKQTGPILAKGLWVLVLTLLTSFSMVALVKSDQVDSKNVDVRADVFFNKTGILAREGQSFLIIADGVVDISSLNGGYLTNPDGRIVITPQMDSGAFEFFRDRAGPFDTDPVQGSRKSFLPLTSDLPGHLPGAPYGALVAGFSNVQHPASFDDFPNGFSLIGNVGVARAPASGGYLFLGVNDFNNPDGDNRRKFRILVFPVHKN
jgi:hypothetical protein